MFLRWAIGPPSIKYRLGTLGFKSAERSVVFRHRLSLRETLLDSDPI